MVKPGSSAKPACAAARASRADQDGPGRRRARNALGEHFGWSRRPAELHDRLLVVAEMQLGQAREQHPEIAVRIARLEAKRLVDMSLGFLGATDEIFGETDLSVSGGQISIQRQRPLGIRQCLGPRGWNEIWT